MKLIEVLNDSALLGAGIISVDFGTKTSCLLGLFYQKERKEFWLEVLFLRLIIRIG